MKPRRETPKNQQGSSRKINLLEVTLAGHSRYLLESSILFRNYIIQWELFDKGKPECPLHVYHGVDIVCNPDNSKAPQLDFSTQSLAKAKVKYIGVSQNFLSVIIK
jgi:hypothetical protein